MKPKNIIPDSYIAYIYGVNRKKPKFKTGDHVRISKYKYIFVKSFVHIWSQKIFVKGEEVKNTDP